MKEDFGEDANIAVMIVECRKEFLVSRKVSCGVPFQMASKQVQSVAMRDVLRHVS